MCPSCMAWLLLKLISTQGVAFSFAVRFETGSLPVLLRCICSIIQISLLISPPILLSFKMADGDSGLTLARVRNVGELEETLHGEL